MNRQYLSVGQTADEVDHILGSLTPEHLEITHKGAVKKGAVNSDFHNPVLFYAKIQTEGLKRGTTPPFPHKVAPFSGSCSFREPHLFIMKFI